MTDLELLYFFWRGAKKRTTIDFLILTLFWLYNLLLNLLSSVTKFLFRGKCHLFNSQSGMNNVQNHRVVDLTLFIVFPTSSIAI